MTANINYPKKILDKRLLYSALVALLILHSCFFPSDISHAETVYPELITKSLSNQYSDGDSTRTSISDNGRYIGFTSKARNLTADQYDPTPADPFDCEAAFVRDRTTGTTKLVSKNVNGDILNGCQRFKVIMSGNGHYAFVSTGNSTNTGLGAQSPNVSMGESAWLRYDLVGDTVQYVSPLVYFNEVSSDYLGNKFVVDGVIHDMSSGNIVYQIPDSRITAISSDGNVIIYKYQSPGPIVREELFIKDLTSGSATSIYEHSNGYLFQSAISGNGQNVYFSLHAGAQYPPAEAECNENIRCIFHYSTQTGQTKMVKALLDGKNYFPSEIDPENISNNGEKIVFSQATDVGDRSNNGQLDTKYLGVTGFAVVNIANAQSTYIGYAPNWQLPQGVQGNGQAGEPFSSITADGAEVFFTSKATNFGTPLNCSYNDPDNPQSAFNQCQDMYATTTAPAPPDLTPPSVTSPSVNPIIVITNGTITVSANASDTGSGVQSGEFYIGTDPGVGSGAQMVYSPITGKVVGTKNVSPNNPVSGLQTIYVRVKDNAGNWSNSVSTIFIKL